MSLQPVTYEIALERAQARQQARTPLRPRQGLKTSQKSTSRQQPLSRKLVKKSKRKKKVTTGQWKKKAWKEFSIFIRTEHADVEGNVCCCTCGTQKHWKEIQAGHFIAGRLNSNLFEERGVHPQCGLCNVVKKGNGPSYYKFMLAKYGQEVIDELMRQNDETHKWAAGELESIWLKYKELNRGNPLLGDE